jgi:hypothetical protein
MKDLIILNGLANAGKTTSLNYLKEKYDYKVYGSSQLLHNVTSKICNVYNSKMSIKDYKEILLDKENGVIVFGEKEYNSRSFLIKIAEEILVPVFGRTLFMSSIIFTILNEKPEKAVIECIGGDEWIKLQFLLETYKLPYRVLTIRSIREKEGIDIRKIIEPSTVIDNDTRSLKDLYLKLDEYVKSEDN